MFKSSKTELTASILKKDPKTHKRIKRMLFNQAKQDRKQIFKEMLFFKAINNTKTNKSLIFLSPVGFLQKEVSTRLT